MTKLLDLPEEILVHIASFLSYSDRASLKVSCKSLREVCTQNVFTRTEVLIIVDDCISSENDPLLAVYNFPQVIFSIKFINVEFKYDSVFWIDYGKYIKELVFNGCEIFCLKLFFIFGHCPNLTHLKLENASVIFMFFSSFDYQFILPNLKSFEIVSSKYITDNILNYFANLCPHLSHFSIRSCSDLCHPGIYNRFYPKEHDECNKPSDAICSFLYIKHFVSMNASHLKSLDFSNTMINDRYLLEILKLENLKLTSLNISECGQIRLSSYKIISELQPNLKKALLNHLRGCSLEILMNPLDNLQVLEACGVRKNLSVAGVPENSLKNLRELSMGNSEPTPVADILEILSSMKEPNLQKLSLKSVALSETFLVMAVQKFNKLTSLNLKNVVGAVNNVILRTICLHLVFLKELVLTNSGGITDRGLMGIDLDTGPEMKLEKSLMLRISLGSKAEDEIKEDAAQKREIMQIMSNSTEPASLSIMRLKGLKKLSLKNCCCISDLSLKTVFKFKELVYLNLGGCQQITHVGISAMLPYIPSLEVLKLSSSFNFGDNTVENICQNLKRLKKLDLQNCKQLTNKSLESILDSSSLKRINVRGCQNMSQEFISNVEEILEERRKVGNLPASTSFTDDKYKRLRWLSFTNNHK